MFSTAGSTGLAFVAGLALLLSPSGSRESPTLTKPMGFHSLPPTKKGPWQSLVTENLLKFKMHPPSGLSPDLEQRIV